MRQVIGNIMNGINHNQIVANRRKRLISKGICGHCGKFPIYKTSKSSCIKCLEISREKAKIYRELNPEKVVISKKKSVSKKPELYRAIKKKYWEKNKPTWVGYTRDRRAIKLQVGGTFTRKEWEDVLDKYDHKCIQCGSRKGIEADHVIPISRGGRNSIDNIQPLCKTCNRKKWKSVIDFRPFGRAIMDWT